MEKNNIENFNKTIFNEKSLCLLNIHDLRNLGRKLGIVPAMKKKQELIDSILKVVYGEVDVPVRSACGRPSVRTFDMEKYVSKIKESTDFSEELTKYQNSHDLMSLKLASPSENNEIDEKIENRVVFTDGNRFILREKQFVESPSDIEISKETAEKLKLENFDVLEITQFEGMFKIITVNGLKVNDKFEGLIIQGTKIKRGTTENFYYRTKEEIKEEIEKIEKHAERENVKIVVFSPEQYHTPNTILVDYKKSEEASVIYKKFMQFTGYCEEAVYNNEDVIAVIEDYASVENMVSSFDDDIALRIKKHLQMVITKLVTLGNVFATFKLEKETTY